MYPRKVSYPILPAKHNLKNVILETRNVTYSLTFRQLSLYDTCKNIADVRDNVLRVVRNGEVYNTLRKHLLTVPESLKSQSKNLLRVWTHQCECVVAQRLRRGQQMFCLYSRLWEERALKEFLNRMRQQVTRRSKELVFSAVGVTAYNWESNRIPEEEIKEHMQEIEYLRVLKDNTVVCKECNNSNKCQETNKTLGYCDCPNRRNSYMQYEDWSVFIEKEDMIVWRRMHKSGNYEYKVYGSFNDVCADDFLNVQIDIEYRKQWDCTAAALNVVEKDPDPETNSDIIYWEMHWPKLFANRDYVFKRRYMIDDTSNMLVIVSKCTEHPACPRTQDKYRVGDYWSHMVIKPYKDFKSPGIEFGLTYYDNPGVNIPSAVTTWVAYRAMPDFLISLRNAAREYQSYCERNGYEKMWEVKAHVQNRINLDDLQSVHKGQNKLTPEIKSYARLTLNKEPYETKSRETSLEKCPGVEIMTSPSATVQAEMTKQHNYWKYLQPTYYFS